MCDKCEVYEADRRRYSAPQMQESRIHKVIKRTSKFYCFYWYRLMELGLHIVMRYVSVESSETPRVRIIRKLLKLRRNSKKKYFVVFPKNLQSLNLSRLNKATLIKFLCFFFVFFLLLIRHVCMVPHKLYGASKTWYYEKIRI